MHAHCTALHCTALHCTALHCTALHCTALHCTALSLSDERRRLAEPIHDHNGIPDHNGIHDHNGIQDHTGIHDHNGHLCRSCKFILMIFINPSEGTSMYSSTHSGF
jgi:hypothetical protein